jgi:hypothetical protein
MLASGIALAIAGTVAMAGALDALERSVMLENGIIASVSGMSILSGAVLIVLGALRVSDVVRF